jgi:hypothetical protein
MPTPKILEFDSPDAGLKFRARLLLDENPDVIAQVLAQLPLRSVLGHVVVSGEGIWLPTRIVHLGRNNMIQRTPGSVYLYAPGQSMCLTYGEITESATVNKFGQVLDDDLPTLRRLGEHVYQQTVAQACRSIVKINLRSVA